MKRCDARFRWVVVGGGAAGCWLARRLAASQSGSVALIEAGRAPRDARAVVPAWYPLAQNSRLDWAFRTEPQVELAGRRLAWPRGKCLGGSSAINALIHMWPARGDLLRWRRAVGGNWTEALDQIETRLEAALRSASSGNIICPISGLALEPVKETHAWCRAFLDAAAAVGLKARSPWLRSETDACGNYWLTAKNGRRQTSADPLMALEHPGSHESDGGWSSLQLFSGCHVHRIVFERGRAVAAEVSSGEAQPRQIYAEEAIILTAGAIGSPELLLRSGVGPAKELERCGIACQVDSPEVGGNLQDHLAMPIVLQMKSEEGLPYRFDARQRARYRSSGLGPLASNVAEVGAMLGHIELPGDAAGDAATAGSAGGEAAATPRIQFHVTPTHYLKYPVLRAAADCMSIAITPLHPASRGTLRLRSAAGSLRLEIDPQYLSAASDLDDFIAAYGWISEVLAGTELRSIVARQLLPAERRSDATGLVRSVRAMAQSIYHPVGTCRAGQDTGAVVDDQFRVKGVQGLRVADASVLPDLPSGNSCAATLIMAELAATTLLRTLTG